MYQEAGLITIGAEMHFRCRNCPEKLGATIADYFYQKINCPNCGSAHYVTLKIIDGRVKIHIE